jgi:hypothetical protein
MAIFLEVLLPDAFQTRRAENARLFSSGLPAEVGRPRSNTIRGAIRRTVPAKIAANLAAPLTCPKPASGAYVIDGATVYDIQQIAWESPRGKGITGGAISFHGGSLVGPDRCADRRVCDRYGGADADVVCGFLSRAVQLRCERNCSPS